MFTALGSDGYNLGPWATAQEPPFNTLDRVASVDIVITTDKSKWSQCVVLEAGEDTALNQGNALYQRTYNADLIGDGACKGQIRMAYSEDWHNPATTGLSG